MIDFVEISSTFGTLVCPAQSRKGVDYANHSVISHLNKALEQLHWFGVLCLTVTLEKLLDLPPNDNALKSTRILPPSSICRRMENKLDCGFPCFNCDGGRTGGGNADDPTVKDIISTRMNQKWRMK